MHGRTYQQLQQQRFLKIGTQCVQVSTAKVQVMEQISVEIFNWSLL